MHLVIGKIDAQANEFHAWITMEFEGCAYLLDPTYSASIQKVSQVDRDEYLPVYSYRGPNSYAYQTAAGLGIDSLYQNVVPSVAGN